MQISIRNNMKNIFKTLSVIILVGLMNQPFAAEGAPSKLESLGKRYIEFMSDVGSFENEEYESQSHQLFAESVVKIVNGVTILSKCTALVSQLKNAKVVAYPCIFEIKKILVDEQQNTCAISFTWNSEKLGLHTTTVFLMFDESDKIIEINEVYNTFGGSTLKRSIKELAIAYNKFQNDFEQGVSKDYNAIIESLFSSAFKKIANRTELVSERARLEQQLADVKAAAGNWTMREKSTIPSADNKQCVIWYVLETEKAGSFEVMAILRSSNGNQIDSIDEVYFQIP